MWLCCCRLPAPRTSRVFPGDDPGQPVKMGTSNSKVKSSKVAMGGDVEERALSQFGPKVKEAFSFVWTMAKFREVNNKRWGTFLTSPVFTGGRQHQCKWQLEFHPEPRNQCPPLTCPEISLWLYNGYSPSLHVKTQFSLIEPGGGEYRLGTGLYDAVLGSPASMDPHRTRVTRFGFWKNDAYLLDCDRLTIRCRIRVEGFIQLHRLDTVNPSQYFTTPPDLTVPQESGLVSDLEALRQDTQFADVSLCTLTKTFMAHKAVLVARSPVFKTMFSEPLTETAQNSVPLPDFDESVVDGMLEYIYTGKTSRMAEESPGLLEIAEKFKLESLKVGAEDYMASRLGMHNVVTLFSFSDIFNAANLKAKVMEFIGANQDEVKETSEFQNLVKSDPALVLQLLLPVTK